MARKKPDVRTSMRFHGDVYEVAKNAALKASKKQTKTRAVATQINIDLAAYYGLPPR
jgi:hypothetical protein